LAKFPRRTGSSSGFHSQAPQLEGQQQQLQTIPQNSNSDRSSAQVPMQITTSNGMASVNNSLTTASTTTSASTIVGLLHQNSMNSRHQNSMNNASSPYGGNSVQIQSPSYSTLTTISWFILCRSKISWFVSATSTMIVFFVVFFIVFRLICINASLTKFL
jgi:hypothetical protein